MILGPLVKKKKNPKHFENHCFRPETSFLSSMLCGSPGKPGPVCVCTRTKASSLAARENVKATSPCCYLPALYHASASHLEQGHASTWHQRLGQIAALLGLLISRPTALLYPIGRVPSKQVQILPQLLLYSFTTQALKVCSGSYVCIFKLPQGFVHVHNIEGLHFMSIY